MSLKSYTNFIIIHKMNLLQIAICIVTTLGRHQHNNQWHEPLTKMYTSQKHTQFGIYFEI